MGARPKRDQPRGELILRFIERAVAERGYPPSVREIAAAVGLASTSAVHHHLTRLQREGKLERQPTRSRALAIPGAQHLRAVPAPVIGEIAAGQPIYAYQEATETVAVPSDWARGSEMFVLRVRGKSMIEDLIDDGDFVVVQPQSNARDGDIVVALLEDNSVTLKRFYRERERIRLQPANSAMAPIYAREVKIQGKVIGLIRRLS